MSKMKLTWGEVKDIESFYSQIYTWIDEHEDLLNEIAGRATVFELSTIKALSSAQDALALSFLHMMASFSNNHDIYRQLVRESKKECGVQLDAGTVQQSVQDLFRDIADSLEEK